MPQRVAGKRVEREQDDVRGQDQTAKPDAKVAVEVEGHDSVVPKKQDEHNCEVEKIAVNILQDERKFRFAPIFAIGRFTDGARRRIEKKRAVVSFAVVIAGSAKPERARENEQRRRKFPPMMQRIDERRIKWGEIRPPFIKLAFKGAQRGVEPKATEKKDHGKDFDPPSVAAQCASEPRFGQEGWRTSHLGTSRVAANNKSKTELWHTDYIQDAPERLIRTLVPDCKFQGAGYDCPKHALSNVNLVAAERARETHIAVLEIGNEHQGTFAGYRYRVSGRRRIVGASLSGFGHRGTPEARSGRLAISSGGVGDMPHWHRKGILVRLSKSPVSERHPSGRTKYAFETHSGGCK